MWKKILYIKAQGLGDIIGAIPFLVQQKELWNTVYQTFYDMRHINKWVEKLTPEQQEKYKKYPMYQWRYTTLEILKTSWLIEEIVFIPYGTWPLIKFICTHFKHYDQAIIPIKTRAAQVRGSLLARSNKVIFQWVNDISRFRILSQWECGQMPHALHDYLTHVNRSVNKLDVEGRYVTIFPSIVERSLDIEHWIAIISFVHQQWYKVVIIGGKREQWFVDSVNQQAQLDQSQIINLIDQASIPQTSYLLQHASCTISGNGGPMRMANLMNANCINIHTVSSYLMEPPVDNKHSFNLRNYSYLECQPCESAQSSIGQIGMPSCVFYGTHREWECIKANTAQQVIFVLHKILAL